MWFSEEFGEFGPYHWKCLTICRNTLPSVACDVWLLQTALVLCLLSKCDIRLLQLREQEKDEHFLSAEAVLAHYHGNEKKAMAAMVEAELDGRSALGLSYR